MKAKQCKRVFSLLAISALLLSTASIAAPMQLAAGTGLTATSDTLDASSITPPSGQNQRPNIKYIETKSDLVPHDPSQKYANLPPCPKPVATDCPDLNGGGTKSTSATTCPNLCVATKNEIYPKEITVDGQTAYLSEGKSEENFCPPTYAAVGVFNMKPDQSYYSPGPTITNITKVETIDKLKAANYSCGGDGSPQSTKKPKGGTSEEGDTYCPHNFLNLKQDTIDAYIKEQKDIVAKMKKDWEDAVAAADAAKKPRPPEPDYTNVGMAGTPATFTNPMYLVNPGAFNTYYVVLLTDYKLIYHSCKGSCLVCLDWGSDANFQAFYQQASCVAPPGYYPTDSQSPHSTICSRVRSEWKSLQNN